MSPVAAPVPPLAPAIGAPVRPLARPLPAVVAARAVSSSLTRARRVVFAAKRVC
jgi:hypothetical protein